MTGLLKNLVIKFVKARWGSILPAVFKAAGEGDLGPTVKRVYWFAAKYKTFTGAILWGGGAALETVCANYPTLGWSCKWPGIIYYAGMILTGVGLADGGTRAPWPKGADIPAEVKR